MICEKCKANIPETVKFCPKCGTKVEISERPAEVKKPTDVIFCPRCGAPYPITTKFCKKDGTPLQKISPPVTEIKPEVTDKEIKPEAIIEPGLKTPTEVKIEEKTPEAVIEPRVSVEEKPPERVLEIEKPKDVITCPKCGTPNLLTAKFCKKDGISLKEEIRPPVSVERKIKPEVAVRPKDAVTPAKIEIKEEAKRPSRTWVWIAVCGLIFIFAGAGGYLYFSGQIGKKPTEVTAIPEVTKPPEPPRAPEEVKKPIAPQEPETEVVSPAMPAPAPPTPAPAPPPIIRVDPAKLGGDINRALRDAGLWGVTAEVNDNLEVTLKGFVMRQHEKDRAFEIAEGFKEAKRIRNVIFVVGHVE